MKIIILSTLLLLFLLMTAAIYLCIFYEVIRLASSSYAAANNLKFGKYLRILSKVYIVVVREYGLKFGYLHTINIESNINQIYEDIQNLEK